MATSYLCKVIHELDTGVSKWIELNDVYTSKFAIPAILTTNIFYNFHLL